MDKEVIKQIAEAVAAQLSTHSTMVFIVQAILLIAAGAAGAFFGEFLRSKGKHLATKADFESLKEQLHANTKLVETVKAEVNREDWALREWTNLRRLKLEELLKLRGDCHTYLDRYQAAAFRVEGFNEHSPIQDFEVTAALYFPELQEQTHDFLAWCHRLNIATSHLSRDMARAGAGGPLHDSSLFEEASEKFNTVLTQDYPRLVNSGRDLIAAARKLLTHIMGVAPESL